jgi:hypothetical protein
MTGTRRTVREPEVPGRKFISFRSYFISIILSVWVWRLLCTLAK